MKLSNGLSDDATPLIHRLRHSRSIGRSVTLDDDNPPRVPFVDGIKVARAIGVGRDRDQAIRKKKGGHTNRGSGSVVRDCLLLLTASDWFFISTSPLMDIKVSYTYIHFLNFECNLQSTYLRK